MNVLAYVTAAAILDEYIEADDIGYFLEMWNDIKDALGLPGKDETE